MANSEETFKDRVGCQGVICPLASELKKDRQYVKQMEILVIEQSNRLCHALQMAVDELEQLTFQSPPSVSPAHIGTQEDTVRQCILLLMEARDDKGRFLMRSNTHWQAVYRIIVDKKLGIAEGDYTGFGSLVQRLGVDSGRMPFSLSALKQISKSNFTRPYNRWTYDPAYFKTRRPYDQMVAVADLFVRLLEEHGL